MIPPIYLIIFLLMISQAILLVKPLSTIAKYLYHQDQLGFRVKIK